METVKESGVSDGAEGREDRILEQLALSTYEMRGRFSSDADYDWYQAKRELGFVKLLKSLAEVTCAVGRGEFDRDATSVSESLARIRRDVQALFEPYDDRLCDDLMESLDRAEQTLSGTVRREPGATREPFFRRLRWRGAR